MLQLDDSLIVGKGAHRICYRHPADQNKCIKIVSGSDDTTQQLECKYYQKLTRANINWEHLSRYYGKQQTNLGVGYIYELINDYDGTVSKTLTEYLNENTSDVIDSALIRGYLYELKKYLLTNKIVVRNLRPYNIVIQRTSPNDGIAVLIDNIGHHNNFYHLSDRLAYFACKDILKKWRKFETKLYFAC